MRTTLIVTTPPTAEPTTVELVRQHCRIDSPADDNLLATYLMAARILAEGYLSRALVTQTLRWTVRPELLRSPGRSHLHGTLELPRSPVQSIVSVTLLDLWGNPTTIAPASLPITPPPFSGYVADLALEPATLRIGPDTPLTGGKLLDWTRIDNIQVSFVAGYGLPADVPPHIIQAIWLMTAASYEHRGDEAGEIPEAAYRLLDRSRLQFFGA